MRMMMASKLTLKETQDLPAVVGELAVMHQRRLGSRPTHVLVPTNSPVAQQAEIAGLPVIAMRWIVSGSLAVGVMP